MSTSAVNTLDQQRLDLDEFLAKMTGITKEDYFALPEDERPSATYYVQILFDNPLRAHISHSRSFEATRTVGLDDVEGITGSDYVLCDVPATYQHIALMRELALKDE